MLVYLLIEIRFSTDWFSVTFSTLAIFTVCAAAVSSTDVFEEALLAVPLTGDVTMVLLTGTNTFIVVVETVFMDVDVTIVVLTVDVTKMFFALVKVVDFSGASI